MKQNNMIQMIEQSQVEWKTIEEVFNIKNGYTPSKSNKEYWEKGTIPWFRMEDIRENGQIIHDSLQKVSESAVKGGKLFPANSIIVATSATIGEHALITVPFLANQRFSCLSVKQKYQQNFDIKFLFYYCFLLSDWCKKNTTMSSFASVDMVGFRKFQIPIPPLETQKEIVRILDALTAVTSELTSELKLRQKQYQYYRDHLLSFGDDVEWKSLGEVGELIRGNGLQKKDFTEAGVPAIHYGQIYTYYGLFTTETISFVSPQLAEKLRKVNTGDVVITNTSENMEDVGKALVYLGKDQAVTGGHATVFRPSADIMGKFFAYFTQTSFFNSEKKKYAKGTKVIDVSATDMAKIKIPIPPLATQQKIVEILDKFDRLTHSLSEGLPKEIELRRKQYEYYRDTLLNFPK
ncbi:restriction endonuclease subunit S [Pasteurella sp. PK-2025]|uniref:restriction endonuclease subunit S n=1 Tax=Pasteurella sp. PK-2025 TaxID=3413133 RepID=UPI003C743DE7